MGRWSRSRRRLDLVRTTMGAVGFRVAHGRRDWPWACSRASGRRSHSSTTSPTGCSCWCGRSCKRAGCSQFSSLVASPRCCAGGDWRDTWSSLGWRRMRSRSQPRTLSVGADRQRSLQDVVVRDGSATGFGYPSGHAAVAAALAGAASPFLSRRWSRLVWAAAFVVAFAACMWALTFLSMSWAGWCLGWTVANAVRVVWPAPLRRAGHGGPVKGVGRPRGVEA